MLDREELAEYGKGIGFRNIQQTETDYLQHIILSLLYSLSKSNRLMFKGGTALQKLYGLDRFSVDLDFTTDLDYAEIKSMLDEVNGRMKRYGVESSLKLSESYKNSVSATFKMHGPIYISTSDLRSEATVRLDFDWREKALLNGVSRSITPTYPDLTPYSPVSMDPREILAEKFRAIMTRNKARDVFDFDFMIRKGTDFFYNLVKKKMDLYEKNDLRIDAFLKRIGDIGAKEWEMEINDIAYAPGNAPGMSQYRSFEAMRGRIEAYLNNILSFMISFNTAESIGVTNDKGKTVSGSIYTFADMEKEAGIEELRHLINIKNACDANILIPAIKEMDCLSLIFGIDGNEDSKPFSFYCLGSAQKRRLDKGHIISFGLFIEEGCKVANDIDIGLLLKNV
jgi:predicted nucleotidyltransferase component of viral defense system